MIDNTLIFKIIEFAFKIKLVLSRCYSILLEIRVHLTECRRTLGELPYG